jgi:hypothetical protein
MGYREKIGDRVMNRMLATDKSVGMATRSALVLAAELNVRSLAFPLMCARPGYSTFPGEQAPIVMLRSMLSEIVGFNVREVPHFDEVLVCLERSELLAIGRRLLTELENQLPEG